VLALFVTALLATAACGGSDDDDGTDSGDVSDTSSQTAAPTSTPDEGDEADFRAVLTAPDAINRDDLSNPQMAGQVPIEVEFSVENPAGDANFDIVVKQRGEEVGRTDSIPVAAGDTTSITVEVSLRSFDPLEVELLAAGDGEVLATASVPIE
jgi:hypothetical protein